MFLHNNEPWEDILNEWRLSERDFWQRIDLTNWNFYISTWNDVEKKRRENDWLWTRVDNWTSGKHLLTDQFTFFSLRLEGVE